MDGSERIERIREMELCFDRVREALETDAVGTQTDDMIRKLMAYMNSGIWLADYESDERGELPQDLKRGVLSEDGLYNLLDDFKEKRGNKI
ncbi:MAG: DUF4298 domain-containing protein [Clostridia bacterium]|nr:DUF4298 domain-containing protein [Clostridia bacterium]